MEKDLISVIVPVYNVEQYLEECVKSIQNQTYKNLEIILVDDGTKDNSGKMCDEFAKTDSRIKVIHKANGGLSDARNFGIDASNGKYIQFIDSDDYIDLDMLELLYNNLKKHNADISMCSNYVLTENNCRLKGTGGFEVYTREEALKEILLDKKVRFYAWNKMFARKLFDEIRFPKGRVFEDILTIPRLFEKAEKVVLDDVPKYYYRQRNDSILHVQTKELRLAYINSALENIKFIKEKEKSLDAYCAYNLAHVTMNTYNNIGVYDMKDVLGEDLVNKLYDECKKIFENKEYEKLIVENSSMVKKLHYYYLLSDKDGYIKNFKTLPLF
jgi:glycosyltransferase involved in cell wall biosynthesis